MRGKIFRTTLFLTLVTLVLCMAVVIGMFFNFFENNYSIELENEADYIASSVDVYGMEFLEKIDYGKVRISYISAEGVVLFDSKAVIDDMTSHKDREEFLEAIETGKGESVRLSETLSEKTYYISRRLSNGDVVRISDTRESEWALVLRLIKQVLLVFSLSVLLAAVLSGRLAKGVVKPINEIDLSEPDRDDIYEELSPLLVRILEQRRLIDEQMDTLKRERKSFSQITRHMTEGFIVLDKTANILSSNAAAGRLLGVGDYAPEGNVFTINRYEGFIRCVENALSGKHETVVLENGNRYISTFANPVYEQKEVIGVMLLLLDVTEKEGRDSLRREFTANVSHELKTPLTSILAASEMMKTGIVKSEDIPVFTERIYNEAQRLINLVNDIIKLSRLDERDNKNDFEKCECNAIVEKVVSSFKRKAEEKKIELETKIESVEMECIPHLFGEMTENLISNAIKYTPEGGRVEVCLKKGENIVLSVRDTGIGIPVSEHERIFERFYRVDRSHAKSIEGTGLGLSIVKHGAIIHNAKIELESAEGEGSCFRIIF